MAAEALAALALEENGTNAKTRLHDTWDEPLGPVEIGVDELELDELGLDELRSRVKRPLEGLKVGPFYGCYIVRPTPRLGIDEEHPRDRYLHQVIEAPGGTVID